MHHLIEISLGQLLLQPPLVCFCCRVFLTMLEKGRWLPHRQKNWPLLAPLFICPVFCVDYEYAVGLCHTCVTIRNIFDLCTRGRRVPRHSCLVFYIINRIIKKWFFYFFLVRIIYHLYTLQNQYGFYTGPYPQGSSLHISEGNNWRNRLKTSNFDYTFYIII